MSPVCVLFVSATADLGGAELSLCDLVENLDRSRFRPVVVLPGDGPMRERLHGNGIMCVPLNMVRFKRTNNPLSWMRLVARLTVGVRRLVRMIGEHRAAIVHSNGAHAHLYGALAARLAGRACIWHVRDSVPLGHLGRALQRAATVVVAPSDALRHMMIAQSQRPTETKAGGTRVVRIYNGIAPPPTTASPGGKRHGPNPLCVTVAHLFPWKGHDTFLRAAAIVRSRLPGCRFMIVGSDVFGENRRYERSIRRLCGELGLDDAVTFTGYHDDVRRILDACDVVVLASRNEPFGRVLVEAMLAGKPVVATNGGGPSEIVLDGETGFLVPAGDEMRFADAILRVLDDEELARRMGEKGRARAVEHFPLDRHISAVEEIYTELLREHR